MPLHFLLVYLLFCNVVLLFCVVVQALALTSAAQRW